MSNRTPRPGEIFRHYKGNHYIVVGLGTIEDTRETVVIYYSADEPITNMSGLEVRRLYGHKGWLTPHDQEVVGNVITKARFTLVREAT